MKQDYGKNIDPFILHNIRGLFVQRVFLRSHVNYCKEKKNSKINNTQLCISSLFTVNIFFPQSHTHIHYIRKAFFIAWKAFLASRGHVWDKSTDDVRWLKCFHWAKVFLSVCSWHIFCSSSAFCCATSQHR